MFGRHSANTSCSEGPAAKLKVARSSGSSRCGGETGKPVSLRWLIFKYDRQAPGSDRSDGFAPASAAFRGSAIGFFTSSGEFDHVNGSSGLKRMAEHARLLAADAKNLNVRWEFLQLAKKLEAAATAEEKYEASPGERAKWNFE